MKRITIDYRHGEVEVNFEEIENFTDLIVGLATLEGVIGAVMEADKELVRTAVDEVQEDLQAKLPKSLTED